MALVEIVKGLPELDWQPNFEAKSRTVFERSRVVVLRRQVWNLEFAFKPVRTIIVDVPQPTDEDAEEAHLVHGVSSPLFGQ